MNPPPLRLAHINISVDDVERAEAFYAQVLGLPHAQRPADAGRAGCWFVVGEIELHISLEAGADGHGSKRHVAFEVDALDAWRARFTAAGAAIEEGRVMPGVRRIFVRDPSGNRIELYERLSHG